MGWAHAGCAQIKWVLPGPTLRDALQPVMTRTGTWQSSLHQVSRHDKAVNYVSYIHLTREIRFRSRLDEKGKSDREPLMIFFVPSFVISPLQSCCRNFRQIMWLLWSVLWFDGFFGRFFAGKIVLKANMSICNFLSNNRSSRAKNQKHCVCFVVGMCGELWIFKMFDENSGQQLQTGWYLTLKSYEGTFVPSYERSFTEGNKIFWSARAKLL